MERYDYAEAVRADIADYLEDHYKGEYIDDDLKDKINDDLWVCDEVTGNASGSYTFNAWEAEENICHNLDLLAEALAEFGDTKNIFEDGAEACDVTIRLYLVGQLLTDCIDEHNDAIEDEDETEEEAAE